MTVDVADSQWTALGVFNDLNFVIQKYSLISLKGNCCFALALLLPQTCPYQLPRKSVRTSSSRNKSTGHILRPHCGRFRGNFHNSRPKSQSV